MKTAYEAQNTGLSRYLIKFDVSFDFYIKICKKVAGRVQILLLRNTYREKKVHLQVDFEA